MRLIIECATKLTEEIKQQVEQRVEQQVEQRVEQRVREEVIEQVRIETQEQTIRLTKLLLDDGRLEDLRRSTEDKAFLEQLFLEYKDRLETT